MPSCTAIRIHRATEADAEAIGRVHVRAWQAAYRGILPAAYLDALDVRQRARFWRREITTLPQDRRPWVAVGDPGIVGFVVAGPARDDDLEPRMAEVYAIYVDPDCWSTGVGRTLMQHQLAFLRRRGRSEAVLWVLADNARAIGFYEGGGWARDGESRTLTIGGQEIVEVRYRIHLTAIGGRPGESI